MPLLIYFYCSILKEQKRKREKVIMYFYEFSSVKISCDNSNSVQSLNSSEV